MINSDNTILIVEDETAVRKNIVEYLKLSYEHIYEASNGLEAYEIYKSRALDLIITDIHMPKMDGLTLVEKIREEENDVPIIVVSAYSDQEKLLRAVKLRLVDYIIKPITRETLKTLMHKVHLLNDAGKKQKKHIDLGQGYVFEMKDKILYHNNEQIYLPKQQALLLELLISQKNCVLSSVDIFFHVYNNEFEYSSGVVRNLVFKLRKIFPSEMIKNIYGGGYMLCIGSQ